MTDDLSDSSHTHRSYSSLQAQLQVDVEIVLAKLTRQSHLSAFTPVYERALNLGETPVEGEA